ncbi:MAG: GspE/PulE family protein [Verrucomicrobiales bacterium]
MSVQAPVTRRSAIADRIAEILVEDGLISSSQLEEAMEEARQKGGQQRLAKVLVEKNLVQDQDMVVAMARCLNFPPVQVNRIRIPEEVMDLLPKDMAMQHRIAPVAKLANVLFLAMADPLDVVALDDARTHSHLEIKPMIATERAILDALSGVQGNFAMDDVIREAQEEGGIEITTERTDTVDLDREARQSTDAPVIRLVNLILGQAVKEKASDVHLEPGDGVYRLRYRIDGDLMEASSPPKHLQLPITSRLKILAGLDIAEKRLPQDGRFRVAIGGKQIDLRVSSLPTVFGEKVVIRLLDKAALGGSISMLGMDEQTSAVFRGAVDAPHGMILVTGPTGSGKTTTLYTVLQELNSPVYNIVTVEDPVEYQLPGINQVAVRSEIGLDFAAALRSILRQDPDIVMVGEIRDNETADIAVKAALTGHQVLSTLHTNDAAGAVTRLDDMGIEPFLISSSVLLTCAQRLVRKLCPHCIQEVQADQEMLDRLGVDHIDPNSTFYEGGGCDRCNNRGYSGRTAVLEVLPISEAVRKLIIKRASASQIKATAVKEGMKSLRAAGVDKALEGVTTLEEIWRVTSEDA